MATQVMPYGIINGPSREALFDGHRLRYDNLCPRRVSYTLALGKITVGIENFFIESVAQLDQTISPFFVFCSTGFDPLLIFLSC